ncbi:MAG: hypothetical protein AB1689_21740 [Thermodesulfobacteriota bacterium]
MTCSRRRIVAALGLSTCLFAAAAHPTAAAPLVFQGDPVSPSTGEPWIVLPGGPLVDWGEDEKWGTDDDVVDTGIVGDVDVVVRSGGTWAAGAPALPAPWPGVAAAPEVVAGGAVVSGAGSEATVQVVLSDGAASPPAGHPLLAHDLDGRGTVVLAYPDLDGDGILGPTAADGSMDDGVEAQEALQLVGRRLGVLEGGVASGSLATSLAAPASTGGLGLVLAAGVITGAAPPLYDDAGWIATLLPAMWPLDTRRIIGNNPRPPDPLALYDLEVEPERMFRPAPGHPVLGTPYAIPLDGSSVTNDLLRSVSGPALAVAFARPVDAASFVADPMKVLRPIAGVDGARAVVESVDSLSLRDGTRRRTILAYPADLLGNSADPPPGGIEVQLEASTGLRIVTPDEDGDPRHEALAFAAPSAVRVKLAEQAAHDGGRTATLVALVGGAPAAGLTVALDGRGSVAPGPIATSRVKLKRGAPAGAHRLVLRTTLDVDPATFDPGNQPLTLVLRDMRGGAYQRTIPAGSLVWNAAGTALRFGEPSGAPGRIRSLVLRRVAGTTSRWRLETRAVGLDLGTIDAGPVALDQRVVVGSARFGATLACAPATAAGTLACAR